MGIKIGNNNILTKSFRLMSLAALTVGMMAVGQKGVPAEFIRQPEWRIWTAESEDNGIYVKTVEQNLLLLPGRPCRRTARRAGSLRQSLPRTG